MNKYSHQLTARLGIVMFIAVVLLFIGFIYYWRVSVLPPLYNGEQAKADLIATAYARIIGQALETGDRPQVVEALDQLTVLRDPISAQPVLEAIRVSTVGGDVVERRIVEEDEALFVSELPIFSTKNQDFIGTLHVEYNRAFYNQLLANAQKSLVISLVIGLLLLVLTLVLLSYMLKPLRVLVTNIEKIKPQQNTVFASLRGRASEDILKVESAIRQLMERLDESNSALRDSEAQVRLLLNSTAEAIFGVDTEGNCTFANPACLGMLGYERDSDLLGKNMHKLIHHTRADGSPYPVGECQIYAPLRIHEGVHVEDEILWRKDGKSIPVEYSSFPIEREKKILGAVITFIDTTERRKANEHQQRLMGVIEATPDLVGMTDAEGRIIYLNQAGRERLGIGADEDISNKTITDFHPLDVGKTILEKALPLATSLGSWHGESKFLTRNNEQFPVSQVVIAHKSTTGKVTHYSTIARDITQAKLAEEELGKYRVHLEELVAERTRELEFSNKELESYSYSIAHDLRSPLRTIVSFSQILKEDASEKLSATEISHLNRLIGSGKYMAKLIDDILDLARISRAELKPAKVNITHLAKIVANQLHQLDKERNISWDIHDGVELIGDQTLLKIALENLLGNAWKYTSKTENAHIEIGCYEQNGQTVFFVKDNGAGFDMKYADKLFGAFQRLHGDEFEGTGIGLATVARIVLRHGGHIWAEAVVGEGATFYFTVDEKIQELEKVEQSEITH